MLAPKVRGQKAASSDGWVVVGTKKETEAKKRIERKIEQAKEMEELQKEQEREALEQNPFLSNVKVDLSLKYADFDEIVKRAEKKEQQEKEKKEEQIEKEKQKKIKAKAKSKSAQKKKVEPTVDEVLSQLTAASYKEKIDGWAKRFPKNPDVQLKCLAEDFLTFDPAAVGLVEFAKSLPTPVRDCIHTWFAQHSAHLDGFALFLIEAHLANVTSKKHSPSILSVLYLLLDRFPEALVGSLTQLKAKLMKPSKVGHVFTKVDHLLAVLDITGRVMGTNLRTGLYYWLELVLPAVVTLGTEAALREKLLAVVENAFKGKSKPSTGKVFISEAGLARLFLVRHYSDKSAKKLVDRVSGVADQIIEALVFDHATSPRRAFLAFLPFASTIPDVPASEEGRLAALTLLTRSLAFDNQCFKVLQAGYLKNVAPTNNLLKHFSDNWKANTGGLPTDKKSKAQVFAGIMNLLKFVAETNVNLLTGKYKPEGSVDPVSIKRLGVAKNDVEVCTATCYEVEKVLAGSPPPKVKANGEIESEEEGIGKVRIFLIIVLLVFIYFVWAHDVQFGDIKHFIQDNKAKLGL